ncbi:MAG: type II secretion system F family protein [Oscillospiraceae bacterium]
MNRNTPLNDLELSAFCSQLSMLLNAGINVADGLSVMYQDTENEPSKQLLERITQSFNQGKGFSAGLKNAEVFPVYMVDMVEVGEVSGNLDKVLNSLSRYYENEHEIKESLKSAVRYPGIMCLMMAVVIAVLVGKVLPVFATVYNGLGSQLSALSSSVINMGAMFSKYSVVFIVILLLSAAFYLYCTHTENGKKIGRRFLQNFFLTRTIYEKTSRARFAFGLSLMLSSGFDTTQSMEKVLPLVEDEKIRAKVKKCSALMEGGESFEGAVKQSELFNAAYSRMVSIGFKTGNYEKVMEKIADDYSRQVSEEISTKIALIEPSMVAIFSLIVGFILLSVILPLIGVMSVIG